MGTSKANLQYTQTGTDAPVYGQVMFFDGTNWVRMYGWIDGVNATSINANSGGVQIQGVLVAYTDAVSDIGSTTKKFRDLRLSRDAFIGQDAYIARDAYISDRLLLENWIIKEGADYCLEFWYFNGEIPEFKFKLYHSQTNALEPQYSGFSAYAQPPSLTTVNPFSVGATAARLCAASAIPMAYDSNTINNLTGWNATTGVWTCPASGFYDISFHVRYYFNDPLNPDNGWYHTSRAGVFHAGIVSNTIEFVYCSASYTIVVPTRYIYLSGGVSSIYLTLNSQFCLKAMNGSYYSYTSQSGDYARMIIRKIK